jgi:hypothetical protein
MCPPLCLQPPALAGALLGLLAMPCALAQQHPVRDDAPPAPAAAIAPDGLSRPVDTRSLERLRGGRDTAIVVGLDGSLHDTSASGVVSGANIVRDGSFANAAGLATVIQNSGANVLIQNATTVNVEFRP